MSVCAANMYWNKVVISFYGSARRFPYVPVVAHGYPAPNAAASDFFATLQSRGRRSATREIEKSLDML
jgi:hypothetical protein